MKPTLPLLLVALNGCQPDASAPSCDVNMHSITPEEDTALGVPGSTLTDNVPESTSSILSWDGGTQSHLSAGFKPDKSTLRHLERVEIPPEGDIALLIDVDCSDSLAVDSALTLQSDDGRFDEMLSVTLMLNEHHIHAPLIEVYTKLDIASMRGSFLLEEHVDERHYDSVELWLEGRLQNGAFSGRLFAKAEGSKNDIVFLESILIATFDGE